jgi:glycerol-3-phosphate dehydrogenase
MDGFRAMKHMVDVLIAGGGVNGCAIARDAALRGLTVLNCDKGDFASGTSSNSTSIVHGGLAYVARYQFPFVRKALKERQILLDTAPHMVRPMSFVLPHGPHGKHPWFMRAGLGVYDVLGGGTNTLPHTQSVDRTVASAYFTPLNLELNNGLVYSDAKTDDARFTIINALQAREHGAIMMPQTQLVHADVIGGAWRLTLQPHVGEMFEVQAKAVVNATGAWVASVGKLLQTPLQHRVIWVKGSHIIVPEVYQGEHAYVLQHHDGRILFVTPFHGKTMIGTTDLPFSGDPSHVCIDAQEIDYLLDVANGYFKTSLAKKNILSSRSGLRTLLAGDNSRDYKLQFSDSPAPTLTAYGGKLTTARELAKAAVDALEPVFPGLKPSETSHTYLPGATFGTMKFPEYCRYAREKYAWLNEATLTRYINSYGTCLEELLKGCESEKALGKCFAPTFYQVEIDYLVREEWTCSLDSLLWLRTKIGLTIDETGRAALAEYLEEVLSSQPHYDLVGHKKRGLYGEKVRFFSTTVNSDETSGMSPDATFSFV